MVSHNERSEVIQFKVAAVAGQLAEVYKICILHRAFGTWCYGVMQRALITSRAEGPSFAFYHSESVHNIFISILKYKLQICLRAGERMTCCPGVCLP